MEDKIKYYKETKGILKNTPAQYKKVYPWLKEVNSLALANAQMNLNKACKKFFKYKSVGFPKFKSKKKNRNSYTTNNQNGTIYIEGVYYWVEKLKEDNRFSNIIIIGHSKGAPIGTVATSKIDIQEYVSLAGMGFSAYNTLMRQLKNQPVDIAKRSQPILDELKKGNLVEDNGKDLESLFRPSLQPYIISWLKYDPAEEIKR